jgi:pSer/pThr/pTyr-binding forkhead associated (FHA) protein
VLDDASVSRRHARLDVDDSDNVTVSDLGSANGVLINGREVDSSVVGLNDEIRVGRFTLVVVSSGETFYKGRFVAYLQEHGQTEIAEPMSTHALSLGDMERLVSERMVINNGRVSSSTAENAFWYPEDRKITFGGEGMIPVKGFFTGGVVAEVSWDGEAHVLPNLSTRVKTLVNKVKVSQHTLTSGDVIRIGRSEFKYEVLDGGI